MYERTERALSILRANDIHQIEGRVERWKIHGHYVYYHIEQDDYWCDCPDHDPTRGNVKYCKHIQALWIRKNCI